MAKEKKVKVEFDADIHGETVAKAIKEFSDQLIIIDGYKDNLKAIRDKCIEETGIDGKHFNRLMKLRHDSIRDRFEAENTEVVELYDKIFD
ncbi:late transcription dsDNA binding protein [Serratia phage Muldoon]|uniref:Late transcription dsDNA binding protein n=1 Tax=Serratia phage Muldoon TaxID=2601678 RepID=A0A5P8PJF0_9CAUD|nr:transcriptional regulator [Serratia phage Muldoon]QFR56190.1 late transcription dsDNA binding protein [Serratia phage Muldoon]UNA02345.1 late transcription dsDNA binding protein [Serratia phage SP1]WDS61780.1 double-stranded DNA binding protein [Cronobacter phage vB_Cdu_VP8]